MPPHCRGIPLSPRSPHTQNTRAPIDTTTSATSAPPTLQMMTHGGPASRSSSTGSSSSPSTSKLSSSNVSSGSGSSGISGTSELSPESSSVSRLVPTRISSSDGLKSTHPYVGKYTSTHE